MSAGTSSSRDSSGQGFLAQGFLAYELDRLFRSERRLEPVATDVRAEATRILMKGMGRQEMPSDDRVHLNRIVAIATDLPQPDAERRVVAGPGRGAQFSLANAAQRRDSRFRDRGSARGLATAAWFAAGAGGRHRDNEFAPPLRFGRVVTRAV